MSSFWLSQIEDTTVKPLNDGKYKVQSQSFSNDTTRTKVLPVPWVFRAKRSQDGTFKILKVRYCIKGEFNDRDMLILCSSAQWGYSCYSHWC